MRNACILCSLFERNTKPQVKPLLRAVANKKSVNLSVTLCQRVKLFPNCDMTVTIPNALRGFSPSQVTTKKGAESVSRSQLLLRFILLHAKYSLIVNLRH